jgi:hypothetical protein
MRTYILTYNNYMYTHTRARANCKFNFFISTKIGKAIRNSIGHQCDRCSIKFQFHANNL